jgi:acyl carrier protein
MATIRELVLESVTEVVKRQGAEVDLRIRESDFRLSEVALDSLGFAILVAELESKLGYDPFVILERPYFPKTTGELVELYERFSDRARI